MSDETTSLTAQCDRCHSIFRVQPRHLTVAGGWLQCGVCGNVFHTVLEDTAKVEESVAVEAEPPAPVEEQAAAPPAETISAQAEPVPEETPAEAPAEAAMEPAAPVSGEATGAESPAAAPLAGLAQRMAAEEPAPAAGPRLESIILVDPDIPAGEPGPLPTFETNKDAPQPVREAHSTAAATTATAPTESQKAWTPRQRPEDIGTRVRSRTWLWSLLGIVLLLTLVAQLVYFMRDDIAVRYPQIRPHLAELCRALDCRLSLPRDTELVTILGSDLQTESSGNLALAVTLANRSTHAMAWPVLELTLTDVKDQAIGRRIFAPSEYLPSPELEAAGIQPLSEVPLTLKLQTRDINAVGYRLQMFY